MVVTTLYAWQADPLFLAAEEIQDSADRLQSSLHQWQLLLQRRESGFDEHASDRYCRDDEAQHEAHESQREVIVVTVDQQVDEEGARLVSLSACDTLRWQLEAFERAARDDEWRQATEGGSTARARISDAHERRRQFIHAIRSQLTHAASVVRPMAQPELLLQPGLGNTIRGTDSDAVPLASAIAPPCALGTFPSPFASPSAFPSPSPSPIRTVQPERLASFLTPPPETPPDRSRAALIRESRTPQPPAAVLLDEGLVEDARETPVTQVTHVSATQVTPSAPGADRPGLTVETTEATGAVEVSEDRSFPEPRVGPAGMAVGGAAAAAAAASAALASSAVAFTRWLSAERLEAPAAVSFSDGDEEESVHRAKQLQRGASECERAPLRSSGSRDDEGGDDGGGGGGGRVGGANRKTGQKRAQQQKGRPANWQCLFYWLQHLQRPGGAGAAGSEDWFGAGLGKDGLGAGRLRLDGRAGVGGADAEMGLLHFNGPNSHVGSMHASWPAQRLAFEDESEEEEEEEERRRRRGGEKEGKEETQRLVLGWQLSVKRKRRVKDGEEGRRVGAMGRVVVFGLTGRQVVGMLIGVGVLLLLVGLWLGLVSFGALPAVGMAGNQPNN